MTSDNEYFQHSSNILDLLRIFAAFTYVAFSYTDEEGIRIFKYLTEDYNEDWSWNVVTIRTLSFSFLMLLQWISFAW